LLQRFKNVAAQLAKLQSARGLLELERLTLSGVYDDPAAWIFATAGSFHRVEITHADLPGPATVTRGKFTANQEKVDFSETAMAIADASCIGGGSLEYLKEAPRLFVARGTGAIGAQMTQWLGKQIQWPEEMKLRAPLKIAAERLAWREGGNISFNGQVTAAGGPQLSLVTVKNPQWLAVQNLTIEDGDRRARVSFLFAKDQLELSFSGALAQPTIDKIFASFPAKDGALNGDIQLSASLKRPMRVSARGQLDGSNLWLPLGTEQALLEKFSIEASGESLLVRSADLRWSKSRLAVSGKIDGTRENLRLDLDVTGDQLDWEELRRNFASADKQQQPEKVGAESFAGLEGTIRFRTNRFTFEGFDFTALETTAAISPSRIRAKIDQAIVCGINVIGRVDVIGSEILIDVELAAKSAQLEPTTVCLTNLQNQVTGSYSLAARLVTRGERDQLLSALQGSFDLTARNGEFIRSPGIDATFDYLNATGDFQVAFPDLDRQTFPYRLVAVKGRIEGKMLIGDEINVSSSLLNLSGQGRVDLERKQIDGKGLIAVLKPVDEVISRIPGISSMLGGSLVGIPVRVTGELEHPDVTYLSPADVGAELLNIPLRILGMPIGAMRLFTPWRDSHDKNITE
jgi:AsmA-like C-terminal region